MSTNLDTRIEELESDRAHVETFHHEDGSATVLSYDEDAEHCNPRGYGHNISTLVQLNSRSIDIDTDVDYGLADAVDRWGREDVKVARYVAMFRDDIVYFAPYWQAGRDSYGWGYVTREAWEAAMGADYDGDVAPEQAFDQEVDLYGQWANGEVYGAVHLTNGAPVHAIGAEGGYFTGDHEVEEESCWGFLGYDNLADICENFTDSPVI